MQPRSRELRGGDDTSEPVRAEPHEWACMLSMVPL